MGAGRVIEIHTIDNMLKDTLEHQLDDLLEKPSEEALQLFLKSVKRVVNAIPLCP